MLKANAAHLSRSLLDVWLVCAFPVAREGSWNLVVPASLCWFRAGVNRLTRWGLF